MSHHALPAFVIVSACAIALSAQQTKQQPKGFGPDPVLPKPSTTAPAVNFPTAVGWPATAGPSVPGGFTITRYATELAHPRWLYVLPNGDVLVAESATISKPPKSEQDKQKDALMRKSGAITHNANRITLLRDRNADGEVEEKSILLQGLNQPFGMVLVRDTLFVANTDGVLAFPYKSDQTRIDGAGRKIVDLPAGGYNNHWTRNIIANADGTKLYISVGSASNVGEYGMAEERHRANVLECNLDGSGLRVFASGLRNPNGMDWEPSTGTLWTVVNERDGLGDDLVPDYLTRVKDGAFYGWPFSYFGKHLDARVKPQQPELVARARVPDYALGSHTASLGLAFYRGTAFPERYRGGAFIAQHGSWNRSTFSGYKVVYVPFRQGRPDGVPEDFVTGFLSKDKPGDVHGRPAGLTVDRAGALLIADDAGNMVWRVSAGRAPSGQRQP